MIFSDIRNNLALDEATFQFEVPKGVELIDLSATE